MTIFVKIDFNAEDNRPASLTNIDNTSPPAAKKMPKKKSRTPQPQPIISDYDTDNYTDNNQQHLNTSAPPVQRSNEELNFQVLQRWNPHLEQILAIAPFATLYNFNPDSNKWEECDTKGTLFVCQLTGPKYQIMILNRKHPENLHLDLVSTEHIEIEKQFIIMHVPDEETGMPQTLGIWMYTDGETAFENSSEAVAGKIMECALQAEALQGDGYGDGEEEYEGTDGFEESQQYEEVAIPQPAASESMAGQSIDINMLFGKPAQQQQQQAPPQQFSSTPDTDFFRGSQSQPPQQQQQNALLDLFKNAKKG